MLIATVIASVLAVTPQTTLNVSLGPGMPASALLAELEPRLPEMTVVLGGGGDGWLLVVASEEPGTADFVVLRLELLDPTGAAALLRTLPGLAPAEAARQAAVLVEGAYKVRTQRLEALLATLQRPVAPPAPDRPVVALDLGLALAALLAPGKLTPTLTFGIEANPYGTLAPRLEVDAAWPLSHTASDYRYVVQETGVSAALVLRYAGWHAQLGPLLVVSAAAAAAPNDPLAYESSVYLGGRGAIGHEFVLSSTWAFEAKLSADLLPRYPEHLWRGAVILDRGPFRLSGIAGLRAQL